MPGRPAGRRDARAFFESGGPMTGRPVPLFLRAARLSGGPSLVFIGQPADRAARSSPPSGCPIYRAARHFILLGARPAGRRAGPARHPTLVTTVCDSLHSYSLRREETVKMLKKDEGEFFTFLYFVLDSRSSER